MTIGAIVYLAQARHSSYGRDSLKLLHASVESLFRHYNEKHRDDVLFLHFGDVNHTAQQSVLNLCSGAHARFLQLPQSYFQIPNGTPPVHKWAQPRYSAGYRHMIRLYAINLWPLMHREGYQYVMRMDEDSFLRSDIPYNLFEYLRQRDIDYAYRLASWESGYRKRPGSYGFHGVLRDYITRFQVSPVWLFDPCPIGTTAATYTFERCGHLYGIYNNFFVARVGFFLRHDVQAFLQHADKWHSIYVFRYNDILWQSAAIQMFLERRRVHMFTDWAYEHATFMGTESYGHRNVKCLWFGGLVLGTGAAAADQSEAIERFWHLARMPPCRGASKAMRPCLSLGAASNSSTQRGSESLTRRPLQSILMGTVSREMPFCAASAAPDDPHFCRWRQQDSTMLDVLQRERLRQQNECVCQRKCCAPTLPPPSSSAFWPCYHDHVGKPATRGGLDARLRSRGNG